MGMGMGFAMAQQMARSIGNPMASSAAGVPPALPGASFHVAQNGASQGPLTLEQIDQGIAGGTIRADTLVWCAGMAAWTPAASVATLASRFGSPPPLPPR
jgi:hypothetical protein